MRNFGFLEIYHRAKRAPFSFDFKENFADMLIFFYYSFFNYFKTPNVINFYIKFLCKFSLYNYGDLIKIQDQRLNLKHNEHFFFQSNKN